jgi:hypothetical protein
MTQSNTSTHKARQRHRCTWCWQHIEAGETYKRYRWYCGSEASTIKAHEECYRAILDAVAEDGGTTEWTPGQERPQFIIDQVQS